MATRSIPAHAARLHRKMPFGSLCLTNWFHAPEPSLVAVQVSFSLKYLFSTLLKDEIHVGELPKLAVLEKPESDILDGFALSKYNI